MKYLRFFSKIFNVACPLLTPLGLLRRSGRNRPGGPYPLRRRASMAGLPSPLSPVPLLPSGGGAGRGGKARREAGPTGVKQRPQMWYNHIIS